MIIGRVPHVSRNGVPRISPVIPEREELIKWIPYTSDGTSADRSLLQVSNVRSVYAAICQLIELVHDSLYLLYVPGRLLNSQDILNIYTRYLAWYSSLSVALRLGDNSTPAVIFMQLVANSNT